MKTTRILLGTVAIAGAVLLPVLAMADEAKSPGIIQNKRARRKMP